MLSTIDSAVSSGVASGVLGRTNRVFPRVWLSLALPREGRELDGLVGAALESGAPIDVSSQPALWGGKMRGTDATLVAVGNLDYERATDEDHSCSLTQANLIELLSSLGRENIDVFYFRVRHMAEEYQLSGALQALDMAKQEGHIGHIGICCDGPAFGTLGAWQFHDAFETLLVPRNHYDADAYDTLSPLARERRVGIVTSRPLNWGDGRSFTDSEDHWRLRNLTQSFYGQTLAQVAIADLAKDHPVLVGVRTPMEVEQAVSCVDKKQPEGLAAMLQPFIESFNQVAVAR